MNPARATVAIFALALIVRAQPADRLFRAGTAVVDISPTEFPVIVNAMFTERTATNTVDRLEARALVLDDGTERVALVVVDSCMVPRELIDLAKTEAKRKTGIPAEHMLVSATHTHSAPSAMGCLGSRVDPNYAKSLPGRIAEAIVNANGRLQPARIGWAVVNDWTHTFNRRWIRRPDRMLEDPFGMRNVRANMHPGYLSPDAIGPSGPVDPALSIVAIQTTAGKPLAVLANYSMHYYGSPLLSSDYYGRFRDEVARQLGTNDENDGFVAIMSQGTSGDLACMDYGAAAKPEIGYDQYAKEIASRALEAYRAVKFADWVPLKMAQRTLQLRYRTPSSERLIWARDMAGKLGNRLPQTHPEIYALEAIYLQEKAKTELVLQALRIGEVGITAIPNEVYALTGLKLKAQSPFATTINIELANGAEGYIPPPEQHKLGGYTTWAARTAGLEEGAEPKIVEQLLGLLEEVSGQRRRTPLVAQGPAAEAVLRSKPRAFWRLEEMIVPIAHDASTFRNDAQFEDGVALYLPGVGSGTGASPNPALTASKFSGSEQINRAVHFAGGRLKSKIALGSRYSVEMWFWNGLEPKIRPVTGYLFSRGQSGEVDSAGDHLGIGGTHNPASTGKLILYTGKGDPTLTGKTAVAPRSWHHLALVRDGNSAAIYLDGKLEVSGVARIAPEFSAELFFGGRSDNFANFEGKLDEIAIYDRALEEHEVETHFSASGVLP